MLNKSIRYHEQYMKANSYVRAFSSLNNYRDAKNPKVFLQVSRDG